MCLKKNQFLNVSDLLREKAKDTPSPELSARLSIQLDEERGNYGTLTFESNRGNNLGRVSRGGDRKIRTSKATMNTLGACTHVGDTHAYRGR